MDAITYTAARFNAYEETAHLLSSPRNAARLQRATRALKSGKGRARKLVKGGELQIAQCRYHY